MSKSVVSRPRVYVRIRPLNEREKKEGKGELVCQGNPQCPDLLLMKREQGGELMEVRFDRVFDQGASQRDVFDFVAPEVRRTLFSGYNASIFAYGQTGSGKTHTMEGDRTDGEVGGLIPRIIKSIFENFSGNADISDASVEVSFVQIYQERIQDLLSNRKQRDIHMDRTGQYVARDATWKVVKNLSECMRLYTEASKMRAVSATEMNLVSSRSHMILMLKLQWDEPTLPGSHAQLNLVDLAGSERLHESGATGETMKEAIDINKSLSALGNVVTKLVEQSKKPHRRVHIPYKDSKLTYLLQSSLGGANLVHFMLACSGSAMWRSETLSTIEFGKRALQLVLKPVRNAIDYTRLAEMESMIERMRTHIASLEEELQSKRTNNAAGFLQMKQIHQTGEFSSTFHSASQFEAGRTRKLLKRQTELTRIMANLPETFDDLTSHCVLFPESKVTFRELGGIEKLVHFIDKSVSNYYRSNAAQTLASILDDSGREMLADVGGIDALRRLLQLKEERCKEAACVALEAVCRFCQKNKNALTPAVYSELVDLIYGYPNQQVQEAACAAVATIVDNDPVATSKFVKLDVVPKLLETVRTTPEEVVNLTKAATNCLGRLAHGNPKTQQLIASYGGVDLLIDVLFSPGGDRDHQVPILASYALVNLCCSNEANLAIAEEHPRYGDVKCRLLEGLARAFGTNAAREGFGRATAHEASAPFPYYGVTVQDKWDLNSSGGRPIFSSFMDNPQFYLYIHAPTDLAFIIQDTLYEKRLRKKKRNNTVYMGLAIFEGDQELSKVGLKQLDFHGRMVEIGRYTSNCENVLHCRLPPRDAPYVVVPFTSQRGRSTQFALSAFGDKQIEFTAVPEQVGWVHTVMDGRWTEFSGRAGEALDWRCNPQISLKPSENCRVVFVLSYLSLDEQRLLLRQEEEEDDQNTRPRLHGRLFTNNFAPDKRYLKALVPLPQGSTFVASNSFASNSYITTSATLKRNEAYTFVPFTESPFQDTFRVSIYCDTSDVTIEAQNPTKSEWLCTSLAGVWAGKPISVNLETVGRMVAVIYSNDVFVRVRLLKNGKNTGGIDSYWKSEAVVEHVSNGLLTIQAESVRRSDGGEGQKKQQPARDTKFDLFIFTECSCKVENMDFNAMPSARALPSTASSPELLWYPKVIEDADCAPMDGDHDNSDSENSILSSSGDREAELLGNLKSKETENQNLSEQLVQQGMELEMLRTQLKSSSPLFKGPAENRFKQGNNGSTALKSELSTERCVSIMRESIEYTLLKLNNMHRQATGEEGWKLLLTDIETLQRKLFKTLERCNQ